MSDVWSHKRMMLQDQILTDANVTATARVVGLIILSHTNSRSGCAFPGQKRLTRLSGFSIRTVKSAISALVDRGHFRVEKRGRKNFYFPIFRETPSRQTGANVALIGAPGANFYRNRGKQAQVLGAPKAPLTLLNNSPKNSLAARAVSPVTRPPSQMFPGDEKVEASLARQFGEDGVEVLLQLRAKDGGQAYFDLLSKARDRPGHLLEPNELADAKLIIRQTG